MTLRVKSYYKILFLAMGLFIIGCFTYTFAQEEPMAEQPKISRQECLKNFNVDNLDYGDLRVINNFSLLVEYFQCRAAATGDINECSKLSLRPDYMATCREYFEDYHVCFGQLLIENRITPQILTAWINSRGLNKEEGNTYASAWLKDDLSFCDNYFKDAKKRDECKAMISGDSKFCTSDSCYNRAPYIKAIKTNNIKECEKIREDSLAIAICIGDVSRDEKICEKNKEFEEFRNKYCE